MQKWFGLKNGQIKNGEPKSKRNLKTSKQLVKQNEKHKKKQLGKKPRNKERK